MLVRITKDCISCPSEFIGRVVDASVSPGKSGYYAVFLDEEGMAYWLSPSEMESLGTYVAEKADAPQVK